MASFLTKNNNLQKYLCLWCLSKGKFKLLCQNIMKYINNPEATWGLIRVKQSFSKQKRWLYTFYHLTFWLFVIWQHSFVIILSLWIQFKWKYMWMFHSKQTSSGNEAERTTKSQNKIHKWICILAASALSCFRGNRFSLFWFTCFAQLHSLDNKKWLIIPLRVVVIIKRSAWVKSLESVTKRSM